MKKRFVELGMVAVNKPSEDWEDVPAMAMGLMKEVISAVQDPQLASDVSGTVEATGTAQPPLGQK